MHGWYDREVIILSVIFDWYGKEVIIISVLFDWYDKVVINLSVLFDWYDKEVIILSVMFDWYDKVGITHNALLEQPSSGLLKIEILESHIILKCLGVIKHWLLVGWYPWDW